MALKLNRHFKLSGLAIITDNRLREYTTAILINLDFRILRYLINNTMRFIWQLGKYLLLLTING